MRTDTHTILAFLLVVVVLAAFFALLFIPVPEANRDAVNLILGALLTVGFSSVISYYFGSTKESAKKTDALAEVAARPVSPSPGAAPEDPAGVNPAEPPAA